MLLGSLGGLDTALREHFSGFRSHATVLAGPAGRRARRGALLRRAPWPLVVAGAVVTFGAAAWALSRAYARRVG